MALFPCFSSRSREEDWNRAQPNCSTKFCLMEGGRLDGPCNISQMKPLSTANA